MSESVQILHLKRGLTVLKAERYFKERRIDVQLVDLLKSKLGTRVLESVLRDVPLDELLDKSSNAYKECPVRFGNDPKTIVECAVRDPRMLNLPIVRHGKSATVGYKPDIWATWLEQKT